MCKTSKHNFLNHDISKEISLKKVFPQHRVEVQNYEYLTTLAAVGLPQSRFIQDSVIYHVRLMELILGALIEIHFTHLQQQLCLDTQRKDFHILFQL